MLEKLITLTATTIIALNLVASNIDEVALDEHNPTKIVQFDKNKQEYINVPGGVNEDVLNLLGEEYKQADIVREIQFCDYVEKSQKFKKEKENSSLTKSINALVDASKINFYILSELDKKTYDELPEEYKNLKKVMNEIDEVYGSEKEELIKFKETYNIINNYIDLSGNVDGTLNIVELANGAKGDCSESAATYYSLLNFYGFETSMEVGYAHLGNEEPYGHAWISVNVSGHTFDIDPRFYKVVLVPLEDRGSNLNTLTIDESYITEKQPIN